MTSTEPSATRLSATGRRRPDGVVRRAAMEFGRTQSAIGHARDFTVDFLERSASTAAGAVDAARLVVSELVTNVVKYAPGPCRLELVLHTGLLEICVHDTYGALPVARPRDPERVGRHGMEIVLAICTGVEVEPTAHGKRVRAFLPLH
ncbi:ATP-binding protein [Streptomyces sp. NPDC015346]|uniref:ATP-binding protein n=1 Tax=Streptomyces sp. NPDC015346 TaxID=3364954 RepID=UPI0036F934D8